jgi:hypothetical protein
MGCDIELDDFSDKETLTKEDVSILSAYHAFLTANSKEPTFGEFIAYYDNLVKLGLATQLSGKIKSLPSIKSSDFTNTGILTTDDINVLYAMQKYLVGNNNQLPKNMSEFDSYYEAFLAMPRKLNPLKYKVEKLPSLKSHSEVIFKNFSIPKKTIPKKIIIEPIVTYGEFTGSNLQNLGFLFNNRSYVNATYSNASISRKNKVRFFPITKQQIDKVINPSKNDFLKLNRETNEYDFIFDDSVSLYDYPLIYIKQGGTKTYQFGISFKEPIKVKKGSKIHLHFIQTKNFHKVKTENVKNSFNSSTNIQKTESVGFSSKSSMSIDDFSQKNNRSKLCGINSWWFPKNESRIIDNKTFTFNNDEVVYHLFSKPFVKTCSPFEENVFEARLLAFTITEPIETTQRKGRRIYKEPTQQTRSRTQIIKTSKQVVEQELSETKIKSKFDEQLVEHIFDENNKSSIANPSITEFTDFDVSYVNTPTPTPTLNTGGIKDILEELGSIAFVNTPTPTFAEYNPNAFVVASSPTPTFAEYNPNAFVVASSPSPTFANYNANAFAYTPTPTFAEYNPNAFMVASTPSPTHTFAEYNPNSFSVYSPNFTINTNETKSLDFNKLSTPSPTFANYIQVYTK